MSEGNHRCLTIRYPKGHVHSSHGRLFGVKILRILFRLRYVERNPVRAKYVRLAWRYEWSSAQAHVEGIDAAGILSMKLWETYWKKDEWRDWLLEADPVFLMKQIHLHTNRGRPLGTDSFLSKLEAKLGRRVRAFPVGRPKKIRHGKKV